MTKMEQSALPIPPPTWLDSPIRVITVWGLGMGTAVSAVLATGLLHFFGLTGLLLAMPVALIIGLTCGGSTLYLSFIKDHMRVDRSSFVSSAKVISVGSTLVFLFVIAFLVSFLMLPFFVSGILYVQAKAHGEQSWRKSADMFIGEAMPRIAFF